MAPTIPREIVLEKPSVRRQADFLGAVRRSRALLRRWVDPPRTAAQYREFLTRIRGQRHIGHFVCDSDGGLVGVININEIVRGRFRSGYLGYYAFTPYAGQGYMREGLRAVVRRAFGEYRLHRLEANIQPTNARSIALVQGLGFVREGFSPRYLKIGGRWCDHERWALTIERFSQAGGVERDMTIDAFRKIALSFPDAIESSHMNHPDFRVGGKIFATIAPDNVHGVLMLEPVEQSMLMASDPVAFVPVPGSWGVKGATRVVLKAAQAAAVKHAMQLAWARRATGGKKAKPRKRN